MANNKECEMCRLQVETNAKQHNSGAPDLFFFADPLLMNSVVGGSNK